MKMAKASQADIDMAIELASALEGLSAKWGATMPEKIANPDHEDGIEPFDSEDYSQCQRSIEYLIVLTRSASLFRVVFGMQILLDPRNKMVDPDADTLERYPDTVAAQEAHK